MTHPTRPTAERDEEGESLAVMLRERALDASPRSLVTQATVGLLLNAASLWWHADAWPIPVLTGIALAAHAAWAFAVRREVQHLAADEDDTAPASAWPRQVSAGVGLLALFGLFAVLGVGLLGHLQS